jgi:hypothetical protein
MTGGCFEPYPAEAAVMSDHVRARPSPARIRAKVTALGPISHLQTSARRGNA